MKPGRRRTTIAAFLAVLGALAAAAPGQALQLEADGGPSLLALPPGYLPRATIDYRRYVAPPPRPNTARAIEDLRMVQVLQRAGAARWREAVEDDRLLYPRFDEAFGRPIRRASTPALVNVLNRSMSDVVRVYTAAKNAYDSKRPYQQIRLARVCGFATPPALAAARTATPSYPSGHSTLGWATAIVLSLVAPQRTTALVARADDYAWNRIVCGVHHPSDIQAGHVIATAVVTRLRADPGFRRDLSCARKEYAAGRPLSCFSAR